MRTVQSRTLICGEKVLITHPIIAKALGRSKATILHQIHFWLTTPNKKIGIVHQGQRWIRNTYKDWQNEIPHYSLSTICRGIRMLENMGVLLSRKCNSFSGDQTKSYTINYEALQQLISSHKPDAQIITPTKISENEEILQKKEVSFSFTQKQETTLPLFEKEIERLGSLENHQNHLVKTTNPSIKNEQILYKDSEKTTENNILLTTSDLITSTNKKQTSSADIHLKNQNESLFIQMITIWNTIVENGKKKISLTKRRCAFLKSAFNTFFEGNLEKWKSFCKSIASSKFLMGEVKNTFRVAFDWALRFDIIQRILEGDFGIENSYVVEKEKFIEEDINCKSNEPEAIQKIRQELRKRVGDAYKHWFKDLKFEEINESLVPVYPNKFFKDYITTHFRLVLEDVGVNL